MKVRPLIQQISSNEYSSLTDNELQQQSNSKKGLKRNKQKCIVCKKLCHYTCPKCSKHYCGIEHFRSHNLFCSEQFYQKQVIQNLKGIKIKDKQQKKKAKEIVKNFQQQLYDMQICPELTKQRLEEILKQIQLGQQPKLTSKQQYRFEKYLQSLNISNIQINQLNRKQKNPQNNQIQNASLEVQQPYWQIDEGMGIYLTIQPEIQDCQDSQYPEIMIQRCSFKQRLQQFKQIHPYSALVVRNQVNAHLVQLVYAFVTLYRAFDSEYTQFKQILLDAYCSKQNENLLRTQSIEIEALICEIDIQMIKAQQSLYGKDKQQNILSIWMNQYFELIVQDLGKIFKNQNLVIETLFRIIDCVKEQKQKVGEIDVLQAVNSTKQPTNKKKIGEKKKMIKKCEYLLYIAIYRFKQKGIQQIICRFNNIKQNKRQTRKQNKIFIEKSVNK